MSDPILDAYAIYDSDPRVGGPNDYDAFRNAIVVGLTTGLRDRIIDELEQNEMYDNRSDIADIVIDLLTEEASGE